MKSRGRGLICEVWGWGIVGRAVVEAEAKAKIVASLRQAGMPSRSASSLQIKSTQLNECSVFFRVWVPLFLFSYMCPRMAKEEKEAFSSNRLRTCLV
jgi:hypothetical protein